MQSGIASIRSASTGFLKVIADSTGVKTGKTKRGSPLNLAIKVTGREVNGKRAMLKKELVTFSVGKWREDELKDAKADLGITDGEPELKEASSPEPSLLFLLSAASSMPQETFTGPSIEMEPKGSGHTRRKG